MRLTPYKEALKMGKEKMDSVLATPRARKAKKQAELEVAKLEEKIATLENEIHEECSRKDIDFTNIISKQDQLALTERKKKQFNKILKEMFPD